MLRVLRLTAVLLVVLVALTGLAVYGAQVSDEDICITLSNGNSDNWKIYDAGRGYVTSESRYHPTIQYDLSHPDYSLVAIPDLADDRRARLVLQPRAEGEPIVLEPAIFDSSHVWPGIRALWLQDFQQLAYLWQNEDRQEQLTIFSMTDHSRRTADIESELSPYGLISASPDGSYLVLNDLDARIRQNHFLFSVADMEFVSLGAEPIVFTTGAWSPIGNVFAGVLPPEYEDRFADQRRTIVLVPADRPEDTIRIPLPSDIFQSITWSPDGQRLVVGRQVLDGLIRYRWYFDLFASDGTPLGQNIPGAFARQIASTDSVVLNIDLIPGFWSDDNAWIFLQPHPDNEALLDLLELDTVSGDITVLEENITSRPMYHLFYSSLSSRAANYNSYTPDPGRILLPLRRGNALTLEYVDFEHNRRFTLLEGARRLLDFSSRYMMPMQLWMNEYFILSYVDQAGNGHVRVIRESDGTVLQDVGGLSQLHGLQPTLDGVSFFGTRNGDPVIEMIDFETGSHQRIVDEFSSISSLANPDSSDFETYANDWAVSISPDQTRAAIVLDDTIGSSYLNTRYLLITELSSGVMYRVDGYVVGNPTWSTDGSLLAYFYPLKNRRAGIRVVNAEGKTVSEAILPTGLSSGWFIRFWNNCEPEPLL